MPSEDAMSARAIGALVGLAAALLFTGPALAKSQPVCRDLP